jgi:predicted Na+-dependent transporter
MIALAGSFVAAALLLGLLFDRWLPRSPTPSSRRLIALIVDLVLSAILYASVNAYADHLRWTVARPIEWVAHVMLNAIALSVILHVAIGRRWPFGRQQRPAGGDRATP